MGSNLKILNLNLEFETVLPVMNHKELAHVHGDEK